MQKEKKWIHACGRKYTFKPSKWSAMCDNHFVSGAPENNPSSSPWVPTLNLGNFHWKSIGNQYHLKRYVLQIRKSVIILIFK